MGKTTKGNQSGNRCQLLSIPPNAVPPGGVTPGDTGEETPTPPDPRFQGVPEKIPERTFISAPRLNNDDFINGARTYHTTLGLNPQMVNSLGHMVQLLSQEGSYLRRIRLVTHANGEDLILPLFGQSTVRADRHVFRQHLEGFAAGDEQGLLSILDLNQGRHLFSWSIGTLTAHVRASEPGLLAPFGLETAGLPEGNLRQFMMYCADRVLVQENRFRVNNGNLGNTQRAQLLQGIDTLINLSLEPTASGADALRTFLLGTSSAILSDNSNPRFNYSLPNGALNIFRLLQNASNAIANGFRDQLNAVRARLDENSAIDIRGCRAGRHIHYLRAVQAFFGREDHLPTVTGPRWYQYFGPASFKVMNNNDEISNFLQNGRGAAANRDACEEWADRSQINDRHKTAWLEVLGEERGKAIRFCQLDWRNAVLPIDFKAPGWDAFVSMNFADAIARMATFFNVPNDSIPSDADLNSINDLITNDLDGFATFLFANIDDSNKAASFTGLSDIDNQLGTSIVPDSPPDPLQVSALQGLQNDLIDHLESNPLAVIRDFMNACKERIEDANNPGIYYYMFHLGIPVFTFRDEETFLSGHRLTITNNKILVHNDFRDSAFRQWIRMLWDGDLPEPHSIDAATIDEGDDRRLALTTENANPGPSQVYACPHPGYMSQIEKITNTSTSDPLQL